MVHYKYHKDIEKKEKVRGEENVGEKGKEVDGRRKRRENGDREVRARGWTAEKKGSPL